MKNAGTLKYSVDLLLPRASSVSSLLLTLPVAAASSLLLSPLARANELIEAKPSIAQSTHGVTSLIRGICNCCPLRVEQRDRLLSEGRGQRCKLLCQHEGGSMHRVADLPCDAISVTTELLAQRHT